jgi:hypothetical protein
MFLPGAARAQGKELMKETAEAHAADAVGFDLAWNHVALSAEHCQPKGDDLARIEETRDNLASLEGSVGGGGGI